jgi:hypothetical protein
MRSPSNLNSSFSWENLKLLYVGGGFCFKQKTCKLALLIGDDQNECQVLYPEGWAKVDLRGECRENSISRHSEACIRVS